VRLPPHAGRCRYFWVLRKQDRFVAVIGELVVQPGHRRLFFSASGPLVIGVASGRGAGIWPTLLAAEYAGQLSRPSAYRVSQPAEACSGCRSSMSGMGDRFDVVRGPVKAWIALGSSHAVGVVFACGGSCGRAGELRRHCHRAAAIRGARAGNAFHRQFLRRISPDFRERRMIMRHRREFVDGHALRHRRDDFVDQFAAAGPTHAPPRISPVFGFASNFTKPSFASMMSDLPWSLNG
jgi:hypothetical protein